MKIKKIFLSGKVLLILALGVSCVIPKAYALPSQGSLDNSKAANILANGNQMQVSGLGHNNIINWASFSVANGETVKFTSNKNYLNLVHGADISRIYGTISGGKVVMLVNPNGILFGRGARLENIGSFVASTRNISSINKEAFLNAKVGEKINLAEVLGVDKNERDNRVIYHDGSKYVPKITVAELTKVGESATSITLDGVGGVILKNDKILDNVTQVITRINGGEIGIGTVNGNINLNNNQKEKILLVNGNNYSKFDEQSNILNAYIGIQNINELNEIGSTTNGIPKKYMLWNNIEAAGVTDYKPISFKGIFEGLGYQISGLKIAEADNKKQGIFSDYSGELRNLSIEALSFNNLNETEYVGGVIACLNDGLISNVHTSGEIKGKFGLWDSAYVGGIVGTAVNSEFRNSGSHVSIDIESTMALSSNGFSVGGIVGNIKGDSELYNVYNAENINLLTHQNALYVGGIIGNSNANNLFVAGAYNTGNISSSYGVSYWKLEPIYLGGVIGNGNSGTINIGDVYNLGSIKTENRSFNIVDLSAGGIIGKADAPNKIKGIIANGKALENLYVNNLENTDYNMLFGKTQTTSEIANIFNRNMIGIYDLDSVGIGMSSGKGDNEIPSDNNKGNEGTFSDKEDKNTSNNDQEKIDDILEKNKRKFLEDLIAEVKYYDVISDVQNSYKEKSPSVDKEKDCIVPINDDFYANIYSNNQENIRKELDAIMDNTEDLLSHIKSVMKFSKKLSDEDAFAVAEHFSEFVKNLKKVLYDKNEGIEGAADITDLAVSSIDLQKELLSVMRDMDENTKIKFLKDEKNIESLGVISGFLGVASEFLSATNKIDQKSIAGAVADYIDCLDSVVSAGKELYEFKNAGTDAVKLLKSGTVWNVGDVYCAIGAIGIKSGAQLIRSIEEHSGNGKWSTKDTGEVGVEVSITGIKEFAHKLSFGMDDIIFSKIDKTNGEVSYVDQAIMGYKILANRIGTNIGNFFSGKQNLGGSKTNSSGSAGGGGR